ncbi:hypothetical protein JCM6882_006398 [Rhodosporidiobolus microsporus]
MNDSRLPIFGRVKRTSLSSSPYLPLMEERRALPPSTTLRSSSLPTSSLRRPSDSAARNARRNFSVASLPAAAVGRWELAEDRPKSFPPQKQRPRPRPLTRQPSSAADDPFQLHAERILRPAASFSFDNGAPQPTPPAMELSPSTSSTSSFSPRRQPSLHRPVSSLRRTATVRSANRHSRTGSIVRGGTRKRLFAAVSACNSIVSSSESASFDMERELSGDTASVYSQDSFVPSRRGGGVLVEPHERSAGAGDDLLRQWATFVGADSPLMQQTPPRSVPSPPPLELAAPQSPFPPVRNVHMDAPPSPTRSCAASSSYSPTPSARSSRDFSTSLPRTTSFLGAQQRASYFLPASPSFEVHAAELSTSMTRVDSEVLLTRMALKRLASTGFEGDALDRLGREPFEEEEEEDLKQEAEREAASRWEDEVDVSPSQRNSLRSGWQRSASSTSFESTGSSSSGVSSSSSRRSDSVRAWKWQPSGGMSASSSATSLGSLRRWSKSTLMDELEREFAELSHDLAREPSAQSSTLLEVMEEEPNGEEGWEDEYVCALDLLLETDDEDDHRTAPLPVGPSLSSACSPSPFPSPERVLPPPPCLFSSSRTHRTTRTALDAF